MARACRRPLRDIAGTSPYGNPGLALQRYLTENGDNHAAAQSLLTGVQSSPACPVYRAAFERYKAALPNPVRLELTLGSPLALGLGMSSPLEVGLTTLHTYGMPIIPGSAIKGVCRDTAEALKREGAMEQVQFETLIGDQKNAGLCVFYDAWYVPDSVEGKPFHRDVVTVHHPDYYHKKGNAWPTDFDDPNPVPFVVVKPGAKFLFAVKPPSPEWADFVQKLLVHAMTRHGVGGKINAGYGWFKEPEKTLTMPPGSDPTTVEGEPTAWPACHVNKRLDRRGGFSIVLKGPSGRVELTQSEWTKLTAMWANEERRAAEQGTRTVCAAVQHTGDKPTVVALKLES